MGVKIYMVILLFNIYVYQLIYAKSLERLDGDSKDQLPAKHESCCNIFSTKCCCDIKILATDVVYRCHSYGIGVFKSDKKTCLRYDLSFLFKDASPHQKDCGGCKLGWICQ